MIYPFGFQLANSADKVSFIMTMRTTVPNEVLTVPTESTHTYNCVIEFVGVGVTICTGYNIGNSIIVPTPRDIKVKLLGKFGSLYFNAGSEAAKLISIDSWGAVGNVQFDNCKDMCEGCINLESLPTSGSIDATPVVDNMIQAFKGCLMLDDLYPNMFDNVTGLKFTQSMFQTTGIKSVPAEFFRYNTAMVQATLMFANCPNLVTLGEDIFYYNSLCTSYSQTFKAVPNMVFPTRIFNVTNLSIVTTFLRFMEVLSTPASSTGTIQDIWNYAPTATRTNAFLNQTSLTNYAAIPNTWKGL